jgi:Tol biopolymer transport system component
LADSPDLTADGRFAIFLSDSAAPVPDLIEPGAAKRFRLFLRDNLDGSLRALSMRQLRFPILSPDGQWIAFSATGSSSGAQPYHEGANVYVFNRQTEAIQLASLRMGTPSATADSHSFLRAGRLSADGRRLLYRSFAGNLLPEAEGGRDNLLLQDLETGARQLLNVRPDGLSSQGNIQHSFMTRNGRFIIFSSHAGDLVDLETGGMMNVYLYQVESGAIQLVSINLEGTGGGDHDSIFPEVSEDGRYVVFQSPSKNLIETDPKEPSMVRRIFLRDTLEGTTRAAPHLISIFHPASSPKISPDGRFVAFLNGVLHLWDVSQNEVIPLEAARGAVSFFFSPDSSGLFFEIPSTRFGPPQFFGRYDLSDRTYETICTNCAELSVSDDGRFIVFQPLATGGAQDFAPIPIDIYLHDRELQTTRSLTESLRSEHPEVRFENAQISGDGRFVVFQSRPSTDSFNGTLFRQVYWHDRLLGHTYLLSRNPDNGQPGNHISLHPRINQDGTVVVFQSYASDLAPDDLNAASDLFAFKLGVLDSDGDGMDDAWEIAHFGDLSRDGTGDFDGDGMTDLEEFLAGTNPADDQSVLSVLTMEPVEGGYVTLLWRAVPGRTYLAQFKTKLDSSEWQGLQPLIQAEDFTASFTDLDASEASKRFYRVVLVP